MRILATMGLIVMLAIINLRMTNLTQAAGEWQYPDRNRRIRIEVNANGYPRNDAVAEKELTLGTTDFDVNSIRVVEVDSNGDEIDHSVVYQFDETNDGEGTLTFLMDGTTNSNETRLFDVYYHTTNTGFSAPSFTDRVQVSNTTDEAQDAFQVDTYQSDGTTLNASFFFQKQGAGFSSVIDRDGNDWIAYNDEPTSPETIETLSQSRYRGIPNLGEWAHPGYTGGSESYNGMDATTELVAEGPLKATLSAESTDNQWAMTWEFYPDYVRGTVTKIADNDRYWFLYEGTPGGHHNSDTNGLDTASTSPDCHQDFYTRSDGTRTNITHIGGTTGDDFNADIVGEEWAYFGDYDGCTNNHNVVPRVFFFASDQQDTNTDRFFNLSNNMIVFGLGRNGNTPVMNQVPASITMGFVEGADTLEHSNFDMVGETIRSTYRELAITPGPVEEYTSGGTASPATWTHISSEDGSIPIDGPEQQTASLALDIDQDGISDFVIGGRHMPPALVWFKRNADGTAWDKYLIEENDMYIEAGGTFTDIDGDGDTDIVMGEDSSGNDVYWWENPYPTYDPDTPWNRYTIKKSGANMHHNQIFGDFDSDGEQELVFWNQHSDELYLADIPADPKTTQPWPMTVIFSSSGWFEGLAKSDVNGDGKIDIVGGGRWFEHTGGTSYTPHIIDDSQRDTVAATAQLIPGGWAEVVFSPGDRIGQLQWYEWNGTDWVAHDLLDHQVDHGHSLDIVDINQDGHLDIFCAEMRLDGGNEDAGMWVFYGDSAGNFTKTDVATGYGNHESRVTDLDGDGDLDIIGKPYNWETPRVDIWLNEPPTLPMDRWERHEIDSNKPWRAMFITSGDMNGDDHQDIITGGWWYQNPGTPDGSWTRHTIGSPLNNMATVYDFDQDGDLDVLGTEGVGADTNPNFVWAQNDGSGNFTILDNVSRGDGDFLQGVAVAQYQSSVQDEIALSWHIGQQVQILTVPTNPLNETWTIRDISSSSQEEALSAGDIDRDGDQDLLLGTQWLSNDAPDWSSYTMHATTSMPDRNRLADMNGDGRLDAVVGYEALNTPANVSWYEQGIDATAAYTEHIIANNLRSPMSMDVADMDRDGDMDVVVGEHYYADSTEAKLVVLENTDGQGTAWQAATIHVGDEHHDGTQLVDIDGDGDLDILSIGWYHNKVLLYENLAIDDSQTTATDTPDAPGETSAEPTPTATPIATDEPTTTPAATPTTTTPSTNKPTTTSTTTSVAGRVSTGLQVLYTFAEETGTIVHDVSGTGSPLDLTIADPEHVSWQDGALRVHQATLIASDGPASKLIAAAQENNQLTIEAWVKPANTSQDGPARIVTLSTNVNERNFTLGQGQWDSLPSALYDVRLRTSTTDENGRPSLSSTDGTLTIDLTHVAYTFDSTGQASLYLNGKEVATQQVGGTLTTWNTNYALGLTNELTADRPWLGELHLVAFYHRALEPTEVQQNYDAGP